MNLLNEINGLPPSISTELKSRYDELSRIEKEQVEIGTTIPKLYGSLTKFISNPSTVSVETYKRMIDTDETLGSGIDFLNLALISRFGEYTHPSPEVQAFVRKALSSMDSSWHESLSEMLSSEWAGFSVTEKVWEYKKDFGGMPAFLPKKLVTYPPLTIVFSVDDNGELLNDGIFQYQRYHNTMFSQGHFGGRTMPNVNNMNGFRPDLYASIGDMPYPVRIAADLSFLTVSIPRYKCIHLRSSVTGTFRNPYGRSLLRRVYKNWVLKDAFLKMWLVAADRKGTPLVVGYAAPNDTTVYQSGNAANGNKAEEAIDTGQAMDNAFRNIHNSSFLVLPGKKGEIYDVEALQTQGDMNVFKDGISYFNQAFMRGLLIPSLVMGNGDGTGSYSLGATHDKIFAKTIDGKLKLPKQAILSQFIKDLIAYNFPRSAWERDGFGDFQVEEHDPEIMERLANVYGNLTEKGYMSAEDVVDADYVRNKMGMPKKEFKANPTIGDLNNQDDKTEAETDDDKVPNEYRI